MSATPFFFFRRNTDPDNKSRPRDLPDGCVVEIWKPSQGAGKPHGFPRFPYSVWAAFHRLGVFQTKNYCIALVRTADGQIVHRSHVFPAFFRHPFMARGDIQVGDTFTEPDWRGRGLAEAALAFIVRAFAPERRTVWYVTRETNASSMRVAEKVGFELAGRGVRTKRFGLRILGAFVVTEKVEEPASIAVPCERSS